MKKLVIMCVVTLAGSTAFATDYTWVNPRTTRGSPQAWDNAENWGGTVPTGTASAATIATGGLVEFATVGSNSFAVGNMVVSNNSRFGCGGERTLSFTVDGSGGNWWYISATGQSEWRTNYAIDVTGNFYQKSNIWYNGGNGSAVTMRGNDTAMYRNFGGMDGGIIYTIHGQRVWDNGSVASGYGQDTVQVISGDSIAGHTGVTGNWNARNFIFPDGQANLPTPGSNVNFNYEYRQVATDQGLGTGKMVYTGGVVYPQDVSWNTGWQGTDTKYYEWTPKAYAAGQSSDITIMRDFAFDGGGQSQGRIVFNTIENGTTNHSVKMTVYRDLGVGRFEWGASSPGTATVKFNNSSVRVGRNIMVGLGDGTWNTWAPTNSGSLDLGNSTINVGGDFKVFRQARQARLAWNRNNLSTLIFDGCGTTNTQTIHIYGDDNIAGNEHTPLHNVIINTKGTVQMDTTLWGQLINNHTTYGAAPYDKIVGTTLVLTGNFDIECGTWTGNGRPILFNGPSHLLTNATGSTLDDNINLLAGSVLTLGSNISLKLGDNLNMGAGSQIYLCGFTLVAEGQTFNGASTGSTWTIDGGTIFALSNVPEPATLFLLGTGVIGTLGYLRRRRTQ